MPTITIDGQEITVDKGTTVIQAADKLGIEIPRYCYHEGLPIVGQCRICLVEIEKMPKLQVACYTPVMDGMVVHTGNDRVKLARKQVLEFLLVNHPIDCPVCDQAGECYLQEYYMKFGLYDSKMVEDKVKKHKAVVIGKHVILDSERCILCTRCVRFCDTISKTHELGVFNRGDHSELMLYEGKSLDNPYSVNTVDICPVGALTERDFRFHTRVWYLDETKSICAGCSTGCNIEIHTNKVRTYKNAGRRVTRLKPRHNSEVNDYWMCDYGRYSFLNVDAEDRLELPHVKIDGDLQETEWPQALDMVASTLHKTLTQGKRIAILASPQMTNEDLFVLKRFATETLQITDIPVAVKPTEKPFSDDYLIREDKNPNTKGASLLGFKTLPGATKALLDDCTAGKIEVLLVFHHNLLNGFADEIVDKALAKVKSLVFVGTNANPISSRADFVLPACTYMEKDGTFANYAGRVQKINKAIEPLASSIAEWSIIAKLSRRLEKPLAYFEAVDIFRDITRSVAAFAGMSYESIGDSGTVAQENGRLAPAETMETVEVAK